MASKRALLSGAVAVALLAGAAPARPAHTLDEIAPAAVVASVTIVEDAVPDDPQDFGFQTTGTGLSLFTLDDDGPGGSATPSSRTFPIDETQLGAKTVTQNLLPAWTLAAPTCIGDSEAQTSGRTVTLDVDAGETITCTYVNTKHASLTIVKDAVPNDPQDFSFGVSGTGLVAFTLDDDPGSGAVPSSRTFQLNTQYGAKTVTESAVAGWTLTGLSCTGDTEAQTSLANRTATVDVDPGEVITCTFVNTKQASLTIVKDANPNAPQDFDFDSTGTGVSADIDLDDDPADVTLPQAVTFPLTDAQLGTKTITENAAAGWTLTALTCSGDSEAQTSLVTRTATVDVDSGEQVVCTYVNTRNASLTIVKDAVPNGAQDFDFDATGTGVSTDFDLDDDPTSVALPQAITFPLSGAQLGAKSVTETAVAGWRLVSLTCTGDGEAQTSLANRTATVDVDPGEAIVCTFVNSARHWSHSTRRSP